MPSTFLQPANSSARRMLSASITAPIHTRLMGFHCFRSIHCYCYLCSLHIQTWYQVLYHLQYPVALPAHSYPI